ncbi:hypothetical protein Nepgr_017145 [Nepenthes gracilis]|uniref:Ribosomal protein L34Ae n=1 Tax=Nepenthes gracilis TaxID=150966 RepID=A0AAD3SR13_NEPGR|nr:hypothetical protein Nepgr_017145 [Nepenthes gracilis]
METQKVSSSIQDRYRPLNSVSLREFVFRSMLWLANVLCGFVCNHIVYVLGRIFGYFFRFKEQNSGKFPSICDSINGKSDHQFGANRCEMSDSNLFGEREIFVEADSREKNRRKKQDSVDVGIVSNASRTNKYQFLAGQSLSGFLEEPPNKSVTVHELFAGSDDQSFNISEELSRELEDFQEFDVRSEAKQLSFDPSNGFFSELEPEVVNVPDKKTEAEDDGLENRQAIFIRKDPSDRDNPVGLEDSFLGIPEFSDELEFCSANHLASIGTKQGSVSTNDGVLGVNFEVEKAVVSVDSSRIEENLEKHEHSSSNQDDLSEAEGSVGLEDRFLCKHEASDQLEICLSNPSFSPDRNQVSVSSNVNFSFPRRRFDSVIDEILSNESSIKVSYPEAQTYIDEKWADYNEEDSPGSLDHTEFELQLQNSVAAAEPNILGHEFDDEEKDSASKDTELSKFSEKCDSWTSDGDDEMEEDVLLQHKEMVKQMKREIRSLKTNGLPTILEESVSPRMDEDLKPLKIDRKIDYKDRMEEIQLVYKSYMDKMRRLDILGHQTMYAIGLVQMKNQDQLTSKRKLSTPAIESLLSHNFWPSKLRRRHGGDPIKKLVRDLQEDLELLYVGQLCLSWEILKWQYGKALELRECNSSRLCLFNLAAEEFQQFQVLVRRFIEDEPFHGPRIQYYLKSRSEVCSLLQVPPIKDDQKDSAKEEAEGAVTIARLVETIDESMHSFWEFLRADREKANLMKGIQERQIDPLDAELQINIRADLQKKERRLKDLVRSRNCIVKKFQKQHRDCRLNDELFIAQVELRLVSRALDMQRLTRNQLLWCRKKLSKIDLVGRKVRVDSSFLLFPC